jgi:hypothetical protein
MCVQPTLQLGAEFYALQVVTEPGDGSLSAPGGPPGTAWWISGTFSPFVFVFDPLIGSLGLNTQMQPGEPIIIQWADCGREEFVLTAIQPGSPDTKELLAQSTPGIAVIILPTGNAEGFVLQGQRPELVNPPTPEPTGENVILFNLTFGETTVSEDQATLTTHLTLTNDDDQVIHLAQDDLSLTAEGQQPLAPLSVEPALPQDIQPGQSLEVTVTFPNPGGQSAVLKVLDLTVDLYY